MRLRSRRRLLTLLPLVFAPALLVPLAAVPGAGAGTDTAPAMGLSALTAMPPGNSGFVSSDGQARGSASGQPGDYGAHLDDQRAMFWNHRYKNGAFQTPTGTPDTPRDGVRIYRDAYGVPQVYGDNGYDLWFGAGYAAGQDRLFLADAVRRLGRGTYAELVGPSGVPADVQARTLTYSDDDYTRMYASLPQTSKDAISGYAAGLDAWITKVNSDPRLLPAEYGLLSTRPAPWTVTDTLAAGVLITRTVASEGGNEMREVAALRQLQSALGAAEGTRAFTDLRWIDDRKAPTTIPAGEGAFANGPPDQAKAFAASTAYALTIPAELAEGPGTGAYPVPSAGSSPPSVPSAVQASVARAAENLVAFGAGLHGGSYQVAVSGARTPTGRPVLLSSPQLGYSYPSLLWELEVHGGGYDARGSSVPSLPTVGIGYGKQVAWALTTGTSKTRDSFIETVRRVDGKLQYFHQGAWKPADCRTETIRYRQSLRGVPGGQPLQSVGVEICRTVHGPVVATSKDGRLARSSQLSMYAHELETVNGILQWNRARNLAEFEAGVRMVTWNENVVYAGTDGHIAYWHPGRHPLRHPLADARFPQPGDGSRDWQALLPFSRLPHVIDPKQGYIGNWNSKPAVGWTDTLMDSESRRPSGAMSRLSAIYDILARDSSMTYADLQALEYRVGTVDQRARGLLPVVRGLLSTSPLTSSQHRVLSALAGWDGTSYGPRAGTSSADLEDPSVTDGPAPTVFGALAQSLVDVLLVEAGRTPRSFVQSGDLTASHLFDATPADNLVLRVLDPSTSSLRAQRDYTGGRGVRAVFLSAVDRATSRLEKEFGTADWTKWRRVHPRRAIDSLTGVIGPSTTMPYQDRGTWTHVVDLAGPGRATNGLLKPE